VRRRPDRNKLRRFSPERHCTDVVTPWTVVHRAQALMLRGARANQICKQSTAQIQFVRARNSYPLATRITAAVAVLHDRDWIGVTLHECVPGLHPNDFSKLRPMTSCCTWLVPS